MLYENYEQILNFKKPGDRVCAVRRSAYAGTPPELWPLVTPVEGVLQTSYFSQPAAGAGDAPPRHLLPDHTDEKHPWHDAWWDLEHWVLCDTAEEALAELERQARSWIAEAKRRILGLESLLPDVSAEDMDPNGLLTEPPCYRRDMSVTFDEAMSCAVPNGKPDIGHAEEAGWDSFVELVRSGGIDGTTGTLDFLVDGVQYDYIWICCEARRVYFSDLYEIPFGRIGQVFKGHKVTVLYY